MNKAHDLPMESKVQAATRVLNLLGVAVKASALYFPSHPENARAIEALFKALVAYMQLHGPFSVHVGKQTLSVDGVAVHVPSNTNLAYSFYSRKLAEFTVLPSVSQPKLATFVAIVGMERANLEAAGGVEHLLQESGVWDIEVTELALRADADVEILGLNAFFSLLGQGRLSPQEREQTIDILRSGPEQVARLLQNIYALAGEVLDGVNEEGQVQRVHQAIRSVDRLILNEPFDQHVPLYTNLAEATLLLEEPLGSRLARLLLSEAAEDVAIQALLDHLSSEQLAKIVLKSSDGSNVVEQVKTVMRARALDREKARGMLSVIESLLPRQGERGGVVTEAGWLELQNLASTAVEEASAGSKFDESQITISNEEIERYLAEARRIDEGGSIREAINTLVDVLGNEPDENQLMDVAEALLSYLPWLVDHREFTLLREIFTDLRAIASAAPGRSEAINGLLESVAAGPVLDGLLTALWDGRASPVEMEIQGCLDELADQLVSSLVRALGMEPRAGMRAMLCDVLVRIGREHVEELGSYVTDPRWYLVRNIANILGRLRAPQGVPYLARLVHHSDSRVRTYTVDALASIGTEAAQALIGTFLNDPEQNIRLRALKSLDAKGMKEALPTLLAILEIRDPFNRLFVIRRPAIEAVARMGAREALPILKKLARARLVLGRRSRELRRLARMTVAAIEETSPSQLPHD